MEGIWIVHCQRCRAAIKIPLDDVKPGLDGKLFQCQCESCGYYGPPISFEIHSPKL